MRKSIGRIGALVALFQFFPLFFGTFEAQAGTHTYEWGRVVGSAASDSGKSVDTDADGNVYIGGHFSGTDVEFNVTGSGASDLHSSNGSLDMFLTKYDADGSYAWTYTFGGTQSDTLVAVEVDYLGNIYVSGAFQDTNVEFNTTGSGSSDTHDSVGLYDIFITKYNSDGTYAWTYTIGSTSQDLGASVTTDNLGNVYLGGYFQTNIEFNTTGGGASDTHLSNGGKDTFITKYNSDGSYAWTYTFGGATSGDIGYGVTTDPFGDIYLIGYFSDPNVEFNTTGSGPSVQFTPNGSSDVYISKYNSDGSYGRTYVLGGIGTDSARAVASDSLGNIFLTGSFSDSDVEFNTTGSGSSDLHSSNGNTDIFLTKYNSDGSYGWTYTMGGTYDTSANVRVDVFDNVYVSGQYGGTDVEFNTTGFGNSDLHTSVGFWDCFITRYNSDGSYAWTYTFGGININVGEGVNIDDFGNVYFVGYFQGTDVNLNSTGIGDPDVRSSSGNDEIFFIKYLTDTIAPSLTLTSTPASFDSSSDSKFYFHGVADENAGVVTSVEYQADGTAGTWTSCTADDGVFDEIGEEFTCELYGPLGFGDHIVYFRASDSNGNITQASSYLTYEMEVLPETGSDVALFYLCGILMLVVVLKKVYMMQRRRLIE